MNEPESEPTKPHPLFHIVGGVIVVLFLFCLFLAFVSGDTTGKCEGRCFPAAWQLKHDVCACSTSDGSWTPVPNWEQE